MVVSSAPTKASAWKAQPGSWTVSVIVSPGPINVVKPAKKICDAMLVSDGLPLGMRYDARPTWTQVSLALWISNLPPPSDRAKTSGDGVLLQEPAAGVRKPRISPPGNVVLWTFRYAVPAAMHAANAASALAAVPPLATMKLGLYDVGSNVLKVWSYVPLVTPSGNPVNVGV